MYLTDINKLKEYKIKSINTNQITKRRLYDIGLIKNVKIKLLYKSPSNKIKAYLIKGSIVAIRDRDAKNIEVYND